MINQAIISPVAACRGKLKTRRTRKENIAHAVHSHDCLPERVSKYFVNFLNHLRTLQTVHNLPLKLIYMS